MGKAVDRLLLIKWLKDRVDKEYKAAEAAASDELAELNAESGTREIGAMAFPGAGVYKYSTTRERTAVEYRLADVHELAEWIGGNALGVAKWMATAADRNSTYAERLGEWWFTDNGEVPDGMTRVEYQVPAKIGAPKVYRFNAEPVQQYFETHGGWLEGASTLLLGGGE